TRDRSEADPSVPGGAVNVRTRDTSRLDAARAELDRINDQIERLQTRRAERGGTPLHSVETYLRGLPPGTVFAEHEAPILQRQKGETFLAAVERVRRDIRNLRDKARETELAPHPVSTAKVKARLEIEQLANAGWPELLTLIERAGKIRWPSLPLTGVAVA